MTPLARLRDVHKRFGATLALRGIDLDVRRGEVVAVLGPNGAGKTTALSVLLGLRRADRGSAELLGRDPADPIARSAVGVTPQEAAFPPTLRVREIVELVRAHYAAPLPTAKILDVFGLAGLERRQAGGLSGGEKRRLALALAFAGRPALAVLDEPTTALDAEARRAAWDVVRDFAAGGGAVLLTTHHLEEAEALATRVVVVRSGCVVAEGAPAAIRARSGLRRIRFRGPVPGALPPEAVAAAAGGWCTIECPDAVAAIVWLAAHDVSMPDLEAGPLPLEDALARLEKTQS